jgi:hypothetical protein
MRLHKLYWLSITPQHRYENPASIKEIFSLGGKKSVEVTDPEFAVRRTFLLRTATTRA